MNAVRRVGAGAVVVWAVFTVVFGILRVLPGDPVALAANADSGGAPPSPATIAALRAQYRLDDPLWRQYLSTLGDLVTGHWGTSLVTGQPVTTTLWQAVPSTAALAGLALAIGIPAAFGIAFAATLRPGSRTARLLSTAPSLLVSIPTFAIGLFLLQVFAFTLHLVPGLGDRSPQAAILPAITLAVPIAGYLAQVLATGMRDAAVAPYVDVARAKGLSDAAVHLRHVTRAAALPAFSAAGVLVGSALAGAVVVETVFSRSGLGRLTQQAVAAHDGPVLLAAVVGSATIFVILTLAVDVLGPLLDPRARQQIS